jgi:dCMP deaminase
MPNQTELDSVYMGTAFQLAKLSNAKRKQVGAVLVTKTGVIVPGVNGMPSGMSNECENLCDINFVFTTKPEVIHAERNVLIKCAKQGVSSEGAVLYTTLSPCVPCAAMMKEAGVLRVVYSELYRDVTGVEFLKEAGIIVEQCNS